MRNFVLFLWMCLYCTANVCWADEKKTETEEETVGIDLLPVVMEMPPTRSLPLGSPEAILSGSCICVTFEEAVPSAVVYIVKAGSGDFGLKRRRLPIKERFRCESNNYE